MELTYPEEIVLEHIKLCNELLCPNHRIEKPQLFKFKVGDLVVTKNAYPRNIIGIVCGYIQSPFTEDYRAVLGLNCDVMVEDIELANELETMAFNLFTKDFNPVEARYTCLIK